MTLHGIGGWDGTRTLIFMITAKKGDYQGTLVYGEWKKYINKGTELLLRIVLNKQESM